MQRVFLYHNYKPFDQTSIGASFIGRGQIAGTMYEFPFAGFPFIVLEGADKVSGNVYDVDREAYKEVYSSCVEGLFKTSAIEVELDNGEQTLARVFHMTNVFSKKALSKMKLINDGTWREI